MPLKWSQSPSTAAPHSHIVEERIFKKVWKAISGIISPPHSVGTVHTVQRNCIAKPITTAEPDPLDNSVADPRCCKLRVTPGWFTRQSGWGWTLEVNGAKYPRLNSLLLKPVLGIYLMQTGGDGALWYKFATPRLWPPVNPQFPAPFMTKGSGSGISCVLLPLLQSPIL